MCNPAGAKSLRRHCSPDDPSGRLARRRKADPSHRAERGKSARIRAAVPAIPPARG